MSFPAVGRSRRRRRRHSAASRSRAQNAGDYAGLSVSAAGDVNGDGIADLIVGAPGNAAAATMPARPMWCSARPAASPSPVDLDAIAAGTDGFKIQGEDGVRSCRLSRCRRRATSTATASPT